MLLAVSYNSDTRLQTDTNCFYLNFSKNFINLKAAHSVIKTMCQALFQNEHVEGCIFSNFQLTVRSVWIVSCIEFLIMLK